MESLPTFGNWALDYLLKTLMGSGPGAIQVGPSGDPSIDGLIGGYIWNTTTLGYTFPTEASFYPSDYAWAKDFAPATSTIQFMAQKALENFSEVCLLKFTELAPSFDLAGSSFTNKSAALNIGMTYLNNAAGVKVYDGYGYSPADNDHSGDIWIHREYETASAFSEDTWLYNVILHEMGHAVGLKHPHDENALGDMIFSPEVHDQHQFSAMSYRSYYDAPLSARNDAGSFPQSLMMDDIATLQYLYGANFETRSGDTTYSFNPVNGQMIIDGVAQDPKSGSKIFCTIWDGNGHDTYDFSNFISEQKIDLTPGGWSTLDSTKLPILDKNDVSKVADGSVFNARLYYGDARSVIEDAKGGSAADMISGNFAANALYGNAGNDSLFGMDGVDLLLGGPDNDVLWGGNDGDRLFGESGADNLLGEAGSDWLDGGSENDVLYGGSDIDTLKGDAGNDRLFGDTGDDWLYGGDDADRIDGGADIDALFGEAGDDTFYFRPGSGTDYVVDFTPGGTEDAIEIGYSSIDTFSELLDATSDTNDGCVIGIDETTTVHLLGVSKGQLTAADLYVPLYYDISEIGFG